ncbi:MAG: hypothetical protein ABH858_05095 [Candidatus Omnitrophota bacterium]
MIDFYNKAVEISKRRGWIIRLPVLIYFAYIFVKYLRDFEYNSIFWGLNFYVHEAGHAVFRCFGWFLHTAGGTILQCLLPVIILFVFLYQRDLFAVSFCLGWLSTNIFEVAAYMHSSLESNGIATNPYGLKGLHDWFMLFNRLGVYHYTERIVDFTIFLAITAMLFCFILGAWSLWKMYRINSKIEYRNVGRCK